MTTTPSSVLEAPLVPLGRLGALLVMRRRTVEFSIDEMAARSGGKFSAGQLSEIERARLPLDDTTMAELAQLYGLDKGSVIPERSRLVVDFHADQIRVGERVLPLHQGGAQQTTALEAKHALDPEARVDAILERYLSLLYLLRNMPLGSRVSLREPDLIVLSSTLEREITTIESRLVGLMDAKGVSPQTQSLLKRFLLPSAGLFVAASSVGSLVIVNGAEQSGTVSTPASSTSASVTQMLGGAGIPSAAAPSIGSTSGPVVPAEAAHTNAAPASDPAPAGMSEQRSARPPRTAAERSAVGSEAESLISYDWRSQLPGWTVIYESDDSSYKGLTNVPEKSIVIYVDEDATVEDVAGVLAHEIGHALDVTHLDNERRLQWIEARDIPPVWWAGSGLNDFSVGSGDFAEAVAHHLVGSPSDSTHGDFTDDQLTLVAELLP